MSDKYSTVESQASYGIGYQMGEQLASNPFDGLDVETVLTGLTDGFNRAQPQVDNNDLRAAFTEIHERMQAAKQEQFAGAVEEGTKFLAENAKREEVLTTETGLQYEILTVGEGEKPTPASTVRTHYHGTLINGDVFDSSYERGQPAEFPVAGVIKGWTEALQMMPVGSKWRLYVPHDLAYGEQGAGGAIGPFSTLVFDIELLDIVG
ncbi:FKBP-type peptidyl-prolyl cis-trans isomerase [Brumicola nitratireducens]|uniref:Peptidyl-prolyl cis-trans isomerase n=1 Tax=Glaciecola nitratireducens (strain JCM 12485 / KCTC 12276 / FR1064) TaxID=1085623 RepID=G4QJ23_GLANF|nr:FKBP-type peptidyl-prolyl cis-trans isomerase [Glaciecola nitratireducens]AEP28891.1 FKBP-type 22KD peptidyl-prolyl cis-trans isomerase (rotamase) [Glaciecola nitratireducens FR1064]